MDGERRPFLRARSADRRRRGKGHRGGGRQRGSAGVHSAGLRGLLGLGRTQSPPPAASGSWGVGGGRPLNSGCAAEGLRILRWVRDPEGSLWGPEGAHFRGEEEA